jgi:hypothetical protein
MSSAEIIAIIGAGVLVLVVIFIGGLLTRRRKKLDVSKFRREWREIQNLCSDKSTWPLAIINGDKLLDEALKKRRYKGKTMGERLVSAQRDLSDNDGVWFGHKLRNKLVHEEAGSLKKQSVLQALKGFRQALKDLGAL